MCVSNAIYRLVARACAWGSSGMGYFFFFFFFFFFFLLFNPIGSVVVSRMPFQLRLVRVHTAPCAAVCLLPRDCIFCAEVDA